MTGYIYFIINKINGKRYVGQTKWYSERKSHHLRELRDGQHHNHKLQNAWNKYGEDNFIFERLKYENITQEFLNEEEKRLITAFDSVQNGYNIMSGGGNGEGNNSRGKLTYEQYCFAYFGNIAYDGMTTRTADFLGVDSSTISSIKREKSYVWFLDKAKKETEETRQKYIEDFIKVLNIEQIKPFTLQKTLNESDTLDILCFVSTYGRGAEKICLDHFKLSKGFVFHFVSGNGRKEIKEKYKNMSKNEIISRGKLCYQKWNVNKKIKERYINLQDKYTKYQF